MAPRDGDDDSMMIDSNHHVEAQAELPWIEKYRPKTLDDVEHQDDVVRTLRRSIETANLPHLLFYGGPGTGKTSTILAVARELYGPELMKKRVKEMNASDERGINAIREQVKTFAQLSVSSVKSGNYPCPPYKIVILDEADSMTHAAQAALRRLMETYSSVTRFCLICNYVSRIIEPIASRCAKFRFNPLPHASVIKRITVICEMEGLTASNEAMNELHQVSRGDMRGAINVLQSAYLLLEEGEQVEPESVREIAGIIPQQYIDEYWTQCQSHSFSKLLENVSELHKCGYPAGRFIEQLGVTMLSDASIDDVKQSKIALFLAEVDLCLVDGADEFLQLLALGSHIIQVLNGDI